VTVTVARARLGEHSEHYEYNMIQYNIYIYGIIYWKFSSCLYILYCM
jgi:hypothetical protein